LHFDPLALLGALFDNTTVIGESWDIPSIQRKTICSHAFPNAMDWLAKRVQGTGDEPAIHSSACPFLDGLNIAWRNGHAYIPSGYLT